MSATFLTVVGGVIGAVITASYQMLSMRSARMSAAIDREEAAYQRDIDRRGEVRNRRMAAYERYLAAFQNVNSLYNFDERPPDNSEKVIKAVNEYWLAYGSLFQISSDAVLIAVTDFHKVAWLNDTNSYDEAYDEEFRDVYATMIIEMRRDAFEETMMDKDFIRDRLPSISPQAYRGA